MKKKEFLNKKKVLVTGGAGFIGSHITEMLVLFGANVTVLDNLSTGSIHNLEAVKNDITFIKGSITDKELCSKIIEPIEIIFHLAAQVSVPESVEKPHECYTTNIEGTYNLLEAARLHKKSPRFIFSSSSAVYGIQNEPCKETFCCSPTSPYGYSKLMGEHLCRMYASLFAIPSICLRYFNVYGNRQNPHGAYAGVRAKFQEHMKTNKPITIFGDGSQTRDFISVEKVVEANINLSLLSIETLNGQAVNIATGKSISLLQLADQLRIKHPNFTAKVSFTTSREGDLLHSSADCSKYKELL